MTDQQEASTEEQPPDTCAPVAEAQQREPRRAYLEALVHRIRSHASVIRHYLGAQDQNHTLGLAAETGVRDVLRQVLPTRFGVTSGFMCEVDGSLVQPSGEDDVSPQTDVLLYDASRACPLYRMNEIEVIAANDVLGFIEVKDHDDGESALGDTKKTWIVKTTKKEKSKMIPGALSHIAALADHGPDAFRAVVLLRSGHRTRKDASKAALDQCLKQEDKRLKGSNVPHVIFGADGYVASYEYTTNRLHLFDYDEHAETSALADFIRILTGFFSAHGLMTTSPALGLSFKSGPGRRTSTPFLQLKDRGSLASLRDAVEAVNASKEGDIEVTFEKKLRSFMEKEPTDLYCFPTTGRDQNDVPCAGIVLVAHSKKERVKRASFFAVTQQGWLTCVDPMPLDKGGSGSATAGPPKEWIIEHERPEAYFRRICGDAFHIMTRADAGADREEED